MVAVFRSPFRCSLDDHVSIPVFNQFFGIERVGRSLLRIQRFSERAVVLTLRRVALKRPVQLIISFTGHILVIAFDEEYFIQRRDFKLPACFFIFDGTLEVFQSRDAEDITALTRVSHCGMAVNGFCNRREVSRATVVLLDQEPVITRGRQQHRLKEEAAAEFFRDLFAVCAKRHEELALFPVRIAAVQFKTKLGFGGLNAGNLLVSSRCKGRTGSRLGIQFQLRIVCTRSADVQFCL